MSEGPAESPRSPPGGRAEEARGDAGARAAAPRPAGPVRVLLTDAQELAGLGAVRSLGRAGHHVTAGYPALHGPPASTRSRHCQGGVAYPDPWRQHSDFRAWLRDTAASGAYDVIMPLSEAAIVAAAALRREGRSGPLWLVPSDEALRYTLSKYHATRAAGRLGLLTPRTVFLSAGAGEEPDDGPADGPASEDRARLDGLGYPLLLKIDNHVGKGGDYCKGSAVIVGHRDEAEAVLADCRAAGAATLAQEIVPGHGTGAFLLRHGDAVRLRFAHRRLHEVPWSGGWSSLRESIHDGPMMAQAETLLAGIGYEGVAMVEFRRGAADGRLYFLEINGRLWGSLALALHAGADFPRLLLEASLQRPAPPPADYEDGVRCRNLFPGEVQYLRSVLRARPVPGLPPPPDKLGALVEFLRLSVDPGVHHDYFWWSDPRPGLAQALGASRTLVAKVAQEGLRRASALRRSRRVGPMLDGAAGRLGPLGPEGRIVFLCYGNICRSPFAEAYWNRRIAELGLPGPRATSAGFYPVTGRSVPPRFLSLARAHGVELAAHRSRSIEAGELRRADAILVMDNENAEALAAAHPELLPRTFLLGHFAAEGPAQLGDPYGLAPADARQRYGQLIAALEGLLRRASPAS